MKLMRCQSRGFSDSFNQISDTYNRRFSKAVCKRKSTLFDHERLPLTVTVTHLVPNLLVLRPIKTERISLPNDAQLTGSILCWLQ